MLKIENLVKVYPGGVAALQGIDLEIDKGMFGLLGPNGAGKSTLMKIIAGLMVPSSGKVTLQGVDIVQRPDYMWSRLGYLPQDFGFYPHLTGRDMLLYLLRLKGIESPRGMQGLVSELMDRVNLTFASKRKVKEYSGGMRQRLGIAQALAGDPEVIIVDEPTSGLDPDERLRFYHLLSELGEHKIVILSTHIVEDVAVLCSRFGVIQHGKVIKVTTPSEALKEIQGRIYEGTLPRESIQEMLADHVVTQTILFEGQTRVRIHLQGENPPEGFRPATPTLEDSYFVLTRKNEKPAA